MKILFLLVLVLQAVSAAAGQRPPSSADPIHSVPSDTIVAVVEGESIHLSDVESFSRTKDPKKLFQLNQQLYDFRESMLGLMLGERLLKLEAEKAGVTVEELLERQLTVEPVTETEVQEVINRQPPGALDPALVTPLLNPHLEERKKEQARAR
jgi:hypothetical protein